MRKHFVRLKDFSLTNDEFFGIIREYNSALLQQNDRLSQALIDSEQSNIDPVNGKQKLVLKELNLQLSETFRKVSAGLNQTAIADIEMAVKRYYGYSIEKILTREKVKEILAAQKREKDYWEKVGMILMRELMKASPEENPKNHNRRKKRKKQDYKKRFRK